MNFNLSSDQLGNPLLVNVLRRITKVLSENGCQFCVIGATARDVLLHIMANSSARRKTRDLDIAIVMPDWDKYTDIQKALVWAGFEKSTFFAHRFFYCGLEVDILPFGAIAKEDGNIYWPPEETIAMSVKCFDEALSSAVTVCIDKSLCVDVASLQGLFILKLNAWLDRSSENNKDAEDIWYIIDNYYMANEPRGIHPEVYEMVDFDMSVAGAYWLACDIVDLFKGNQINYYADIISDQLQVPEESRLFTQILETHNYLVLSKVVRAFFVMLGVFRRGSD